MNEIERGHIRKLRSQLTMPVEYALPLDDQLLSLNQYIGSEIKLVFSGNINCIRCGRKTKKSYNQGHCYPCFRDRADLEVCVLRPEKCNHFEEKYRETDWAKNHCLVDHFVYLSNTSGLKVGITRNDQVPTRWIDQGATQALAIMRVASRYYSGLVEVAFKELVNDRTNWQRMLKANAEHIDLQAQAKKLLGQLEPAIAELKKQHGESGFTILNDAQVVNIEYPVEVFPEKVKAHNFDKTPEVSGVLKGIKGQYLILDTGVLNVRKFTAYEVTFLAA